MVPMLNPLVRSSIVTGDEATLDAGVSSRFHFVEESTQVTFAMRFVGIAVQAFGVGEDGVGEVVVLVDEEINIPPGTLALMIKEVELVDSSFYCVQLFFDALRQKVGIHLTEEVETDLAMRIQSFAVIVQLAGDAGEVEV